MRWGWGLATGRSTRKVPLKPDQDKHKEDVLRGGGHAAPKQSGGLLHAGSVEHSPTWSPVAP